MHTFHVQKSIPHPVDTVWQLLDRFSETHVYHPVVGHSESVNGQLTGMGAKRQCDMYAGGSVQEQIVEYRPEEHRYAIEVTDHGPFPLNAMRVDIRVEPGATGGSTVTFQGGFQPKFGPAGWVMAKVMMKAQFEKMMGQVIDGIDQHLTTGRIIVKDGALGEPLAA